MQPVTFRRTDDFSLTLRFDDRKTAVVGTVTFLREDKKLTNPISVTECSLIRERQGRGNRLRGNGKIPAVVSTEF